MISVRLRNLHVALVTLIAALLAGCAAERSPVFDVDWEKKVREEMQREAKTRASRRAQLEVPGDLKADFDEPPAEPDVASDGPLQLSVEQATLLALRNNRDLAVQQLTPVIVGTYEQIERGVFDPEVFAELEYNRGIRSETARSTGDQFSVKAKEVVGAAGVRQELPSGTSIEASAEQGRSISNRAPEQQEARLGLTITQSLLRGRGPAVNLVAIRQAQLDTVASVYELRGYTEALLAETEIAYWNFTLAEQEIAIFDRSLEVARRQLSEIEQRIEVGVLPTTEAAAARAEVARRDQALIEARSAVESRRLRLLSLINPGRSGGLTRRVVATTAPTIESSPITDVDDRRKLAERMRPDLNEARLRLRQNRLETIVTRNGLLPKLDLFVAVGKTGFADTFTDSFRQINSNTYDFAAGVSFSQYLGNRAAEARDLNARLSRRQSAAAIANLRQIIDLDVRLAINEVERARQQIAASTTTRELQEQTLLAEKQRFDVGSSTALLVAQAQRDLLAAQIAEVKARISYRIALVNLYLAEGSLLDRRGVRLDPPDPPR